jgi:hypothetical protein
MSKVEEDIITRYYKLNEESRGGHNTLGEALLQTMPSLLLMSSLN